MKIFGYEMSKDAINIVIIYSGAHWDTYIVGHIGTMSHCAPNKLSQSAPPAPSAPERVIRGKCRQKIM